MMAEKYPRQSKIYSKQNVKPLKEDYSQCSRQPAEPKENQVTKTLASDM